MLDKILESRVIREILKGIWIKKEMQFYNQIAQ